MKQTVGLLAHVDAGKTTLSEQLLYRTGAVRTLGRVDHQSAHLDSDELERRRGITIFSGEALCRCHDTEFYLVDTPGHADFISEAERAMGILDCAVLIVSAVEGVQAHTETLWRRLLSHRIPTLLFINKTDRAGADTARVLRECKERFGGLFVMAQGLSASAPLPEALKEEAAQSDDNLLLRYLEGVAGEGELKDGLARRFYRRELFPVFCGAALRGAGVDELLCGLSLLLSHAETGSENGLSAKVYKVRHDSNGRRVTYLKILSGALRAKETVSCPPDESGEPARQKIDALWGLSGVKYTVCAKAGAGDLCCISGLSGVKPGDILGENPKKGENGLCPMLVSQVLYDPAVPQKTVLRAFMELEDEDPMLRVEYDAALSAIRVQIMGEIQLEVLSELVKSRYQLNVSFGECEVLYQETIKAPVVGYGHFEPLRHYAEVVLRLSPLPRGAGLRFKSECPLDVLASNYQNAVRTHFFEKAHKGALIGAPVTDVECTLLVGRAHLKHTEGGDFREATHRAVRQALFGAESVLLEPYCRFRVEVEQAALGRVLSDIEKRHGESEPPVQRADGRVEVSGRAPAAAFLSYAGELASFTKGRGRMVSAFGGYDLCHNPKEIMEKTGYDKEGDVENPASSVFCSHGSGFVVKWDEVERYIHCK